MIEAAALTIAVAIDKLAGEPPNAVHPVAWMGTVIARARDLGPKRGTALQLGWGALMALGIPSAFAAASYALITFTERSPLATLAATVLLVKPTFALRALQEAARAVGSALVREDVQDARIALGSLCSREAKTLDEPALVAATVESVAENASDSFVAPLFYFVLFGVPGAVFYRAVNTLDAMIGYRGRFEYLGKASARLDDALNFAPARITAALLVVAGALLGKDAKGAVRIWRRDAKKTESPNAGRPMAAMAGLLGVALEKEGHYRLGDAKSTLARGHIADACRVLFVTGLLAWALALAALFTRAWLS